MTFLSSIDWLSYTSYSTKLAEAFADINEPFLAPETPLIPSYKEDPRGESEVIGDLSKGELYLNNKRLPYA